MAGANSNIQLTGLDFNEIKQNFVTYLSSQDTFKDYNFEGSAMSVLLDVLAYNTQYNAYYLNMIGNEMFLDSATQRASVISQAKLLNYTPKSAIAPEAVVNVTINNVTDASLTIPSYTHFISESIDGVNYTFVTTDSHTVNTVSGSAVFNNLTIKQGVPVSYSYTYNSTNNPEGLFELPDDTIDTSTLLVSVQKSSSNTFTETFILPDSVLYLDPDSKVYFLQESQKGTYEIYFGDGILGRQLVDGNIVRLRYLTTEGSAAAGANNFVLMDNISGYGSSITTSVTEASTGGNKETLSSIKYQAPKSYSAQNRAVTKEDYITLIQQNKLGYSFDAVNVWGGEQNDPPVYGAVFVSLKPSGAYNLTDTQKQRLISDVIEPISVMTVIPNIVDPDYTYIKLDINVLYDPKKTNLTSTALEQSVRLAISSFATSTLNTFNSTFSSSELTMDIQNVDQSIITNEISVQLQKKFYPTLNVAKNYKFNYGSPIKKSNFLSGISSSPSYQYISDVYGTLTDVYLEEVASSTSGVESISIINPGFNYVYAPTVTVVGDGTGATAEAAIDTNGKLKSITVTNSGLNYTSAYVVITADSNDTSGQGAVGVVNLSGRYGTLRSYYNNTTRGKTVINENAGTIDYQNGTLNLTDFNPSNVNNDLGQLSITVTPTSSIVSSSYNRIITIDPFDPNAVTVNITAKT
jgi:hypothetical protein